MRPLKIFKSLLANRDGRMCFYCATPLSLSKMTVDHFVPEKLGGKTEMENLRLACRKCNEAKGGLSPEHYLEHCVSKKRRKWIAQHTIEEPNETTAEEAGEAEGVVLVGIHRSSHKLD